jgi:DNA ligase (NAD+)
LTHDRAESEVDALVEKLKEHQNQYYQGRPSVSDAEYDRLFDRLQELEEQFPDLQRADSPSLRIGSDLSQEFPQVEHTLPVLSLDKSYTADELAKWIAKIQRGSDKELSFILEEKIDGAGIVLYYEGGILTRAVTRGNGAIGNDITGNVRTIPGVPLKLARSVDVAARGEIFLPKPLFAEINSTMEIPYANPRNLAAGTLRRIKSSEVAKVPLDIFVYEGYLEGEHATHFEILTELEELGFKMNPNVGFFSDYHQLDELRRDHPTWRVGRLGDVEGLIKEAREKRDTLSYEIDGLVLKVNELAAREELGYTGHHPRWAMAFKFESPVGRTEVKEIEIQIGRTGRATPVARVAPVRISGSTISNVTLHNQEYIDMLELAVGDTVEVSKRGDVIPAVERVLEKNELGHSTWQIPPLCPTCQSQLVKSGAHHFCVNPDCEDQIRGRLFFFVGRSQMDIENLGPETIEVLLKKKLVRDLPDIYTFDTEKLRGEPGFGDKKIRLIKEGIERSREKPFKTVLVSLGIPDLGQNAAELLIEAGYRDIDSLLALADRQDAEALKAIHGIGEKTASQILSELGKTAVRRRIEGLRKAGLRLVADESTEGQELTFQGQVWCVTGSFTHFKPRETAMEEVKRRGGRVASSVTSRTTHLLAGEGAGSKLQKAEALGTLIVKEEQFLKLLET